MDHLRLGASLYVPATRADLPWIADGTKLNHARSVIFCTEDSVREDELPAALNNLASMLRPMAPREEALRFVRVRNPGVLAALLDMPGILGIDGFVLPKITADNINAYTDLLAQRGLLSHFKLMPTLETREAFSAEAMTALRDHLTVPGIRESILSLRIGGNDLLNLLGVRRSRHRTIYSSPLGATIAQLVTTFKPHGFNLTSPVYEFLYDMEILEAELAMDAEYGLFGKTAIHPDQIAVIERSYMVSEQDEEMAEAILADNAPAVFNMHGTMCEVATHAAWARDIRARAKIYGVYGRKNAQHKHAAKRLAA